MGFGLAVSLHEVCFEPVAIGQIVKLAPSSELRAIRIVNRSDRDTEDQFLHLVISSRMQSRERDAIAIFP